MAPKNPTAPAAHPLTAQQQNEAAIYGWLVGTEHLTGAEAAGVLGNAQVESNFDPTASNPREGAIGLFQWEGGRRTALQRYAAAHHGKETDLQMQLGYLGTELAGGYSSVLARLRAATSPQDAARIWDVGPGGTNSGTGFENSSGAADQQRQSNAATIYGQITRGQLGPASQLGGTYAPAAGDLPGSIVSAAGAASGALGDAGGAALAGAAGLPATLAASAIGALGSAFSLGGVGALVVKAMFTGGALGLAVLGAYAAAHPAREG